MEFDPVLLARIQFAFTISFHIIFPAFTIGLSAFIAVLLLLWTATKNDKFHRIARFWTKIFAVSFAMGVVSGIVLSYQFGTNWSRFSEFSGNVIGPLIGYEVLTAFYLEATFLGILLFGWNRFPSWLVTLSAVLVALGTATSAFWILSANSWMHTPAGHEVRDGIAYPLDWLQVVFNPSFPYRLAHMVNAAYLTTAVVVLAVGARYLLAGRHVEESHTMLRMAVGMIAIAAPLQLVIGDLHGLNTLEHQPVKVAAMEGHWNGEAPGDLVLFGIPDEEARTNHYAVVVPHLGSLILTHTLEGTYPGISDFPEEEWPPILNVFFSFRIMVGIGLLLIAVGFWGAYLWWRGRLFTSRWFLLSSSYMWPLGFIAILAGWFVTEQGRQPWLVYGLLRTADGVSPVPGASVASTLALFVFIYGIVFSMGIYYINRLINAGPKDVPIETPAGVPNRPLSAAEEAAREATGRSRGEGPGRPLSEPEG
ncbi:cytochrome ubiquinol oxidase subunit I [Chelativorans salis]|uniref:Cytochrome ubiquinol oxidase subunit I n=1 Tax=Chelativorans salis TaxID=2978478 RepID=A0ABT2LHG9_9HYPH|nr:cytochrome ubiquinol oxidase subunit I [Chelativorans sp. EGI FJ00035]MCT7373935.1 cytochrome ubiquinol oxidase subunit I [Chelativorans sp. EGI FJ00035]